ncbi:MAG: CoA transferase, partial [Thermoplasmatales archaeon]
MLEGIRVVESSLHLAGPYCGRFLAELGAEVIKIEPLGGEANRRSVPRKNGIAMLYENYNVNKKSLALDLKS